MSEPLQLRSEAEVAALRLQVLRRCLQRQPIAEIAEALEISTSYAVKLRKDILQQVQSVELREAELLRQLEIEAVREDLRLLTERQAAHPAHGYDLYRAKLDLQERLLRLQGIDVGGKAGTSVQVNINAPGAALAMHSTPTPELQALLDEIAAPPAAQLPEAPQDGYCAAAHSSGVQPAKPVA